MSKVFALIQGRMESERAPGKSCAELGGKPIFVHIAERIQQVLPDAMIVIHTPANLINDPIAMLGRAYSYEVFRFYDECLHGMLRAHRACLYYDLQPDDIIVWGFAESPCIYTKLVPFIVKKMQETGCDRFWWGENPTQMLIWGVAWTHVQSYRGFLKNIEEMKETDLEGVGWTPLSGEYRLLAPIPEYLKQSWPWRPLYMDYPEQVSQAKIIYNRLYKGAPLDIFDVYKLLQDEPAIAHMTATCPRDTGYGKHLDWFWKALRGQPHERFELPEL